MRSFLIVASIAGLLTLVANGQAQDHAAQNDSSQQVPDAPQPQKKSPPAHTARAGDKTTPADQTAPKQAPAKDDNAFPEAASRDAAKAASGAKPSTAEQNPFPEDVSKDAAHAASGAKPSTVEQNPFPEDVSKDAAKGASGAKPSTAGENPFPEDVSRDAAKAAGNPEPAPAVPHAPESDLPPGVSSSQSSGALGDPDDVTETTGNDPARAKKDTQVGSFYLKTGDYQGALMRYKDAMASDPTNVEAIFGLAEAQRALKKNAEAAQSYQLYLDIVPNGPRSKEALKALKTLQASK